MAVDVVVVVVAGIVLVFLVGVVVVVVLEGPTTGCGAPSDLAGFATPGSSVVLLVVNVG